MGSDKARPAYVEEEDDTGKTVRGTRRSAAVPKEKPKVSHREREGELRTSKSRRTPGESRYPPESSSQHIEVRDKAQKLERRLSTSSSTKSPRKPTRPPSAHGNRQFPGITIPSSSSRQQEATYYGVSPSAMTPDMTHPSLAIRPRPQSSNTYPRPASYYSASTSQGGAGPPISNSAYYQQMITPSYPPPSPSSSFIRYAATPQPQQQYAVAAQYQSVQPGADYFTPHAMSRPLASRFDPIARTQSAMDTVPRNYASGYGIRDMNPRTFEDTYNDGGYYEDNYASENEAAVTIRRKDRRSSRVPAASSTYSSKNDADTIAMPPPAPRPKTGILRRSTDYGSQELEYQDSRTQYRDEPRGPARRPSMTRHSVSYDLDRGSGGVRIEPANTGRRRSGFYDNAASSGTTVSSNYEDKINAAANYQHDVGEVLPLTTETLRRQQQREAGSRSSTKSSHSRDESDYKKSATTRTTRSGSGGDDENVTIKVTGQARVMVGGAQIDCTDGGAIEIKRNQRLRGMGGSERSNSEYGEPYQHRRIEDRQSRVTRPSARSRISSQSGQSYTRTPTYPQDNYT